MAKPKRFEFLEGITEADYAFDAFGKDLDEVFENSALALTEVMADPKTVKPKKKKEIELKADKLDHLLYDFLDEIVYLKDSEVFLVNKIKASVKKNKGYSLKAALYGDKIDPKKQELRNDVKAVTYHQFGIKQERKGWKARVVLDV